MRPSDRKSKLALKLTFIIIALMRRKGSRKSYLLDSCEPIAR
jgi:hypothetical protein